MAMTAPTAQQAAARHPNEVDLKRIARALRSRRRYRYVSPSVHAAPGGYRIDSPCCSRNVDPGGGVIDIALLEHRAEAPDGGPWRLYARDHVAGAWQFCGSHRRLADALDLLCADPERRFWR
jgi:hypothetical protein